MLRRLGHPVKTAERFVELLDRTPQENPGLEKLFSKPSVFTGA